MPRTAPPPQALSAAQATAPATTGFQTIGAKQASISRCKARSADMGRRLGVYQAWIRRPHRTYP